LQTFSSVKFTPLLNLAKTYFTTTVAKTFPTLARMTYDTNRRCCAFFGVQIERWLRVQVICRNIAWKRKEQFNLCWISQNSLWNKAVLCLSRKCLQIRKSFNWYLIGTDCHFPRPCWMLMCIGPVRGFQLWNGLLLVLGLLAPVDCCSDLMNSTKWRCSRSCEGWMKISWSLKIWI